MDLETLCLSIDILYFVQFGVVDLAVSVHHPLGNDDRPNVSAKGECKDFVQFDYPEYIF